MNSEAVKHGFRTERAAAGESSGRSAPCAPTFPTSTGARTIARRNSRMTFSPPSPTPDTSASPFPKRYGGSGLGITEAALVMREVAASGGAMAAASCDPSFDLRRQPAGLPWHRGAEAPLPAESGARRDARRIRRDRARRRQRHHAHQDRGAPRRRLLRHQRPQGFHHQGARSEARCCILTRTTPFEQVKPKRPTA